MVIFIAATAHMLYMSDNLFMHAPYLSAIATYALIVLKFPLLHHCILYKERHLVRKIR